MVTLSQWKVRTQALTQHLARTSERTKSVLKRARKLHEQADIEANLKKIRTNMQSTSE